MTQLRIPKEQNIDTKKLQAKNYHNKLHTWQHTISICVYTPSYSPYNPMLPLFHTAVRVDFYYLTIELIWMWQRQKEKSLSMLPIECWKGYQRKQTLHWQIVKWHFWGPLKTSKLFLSFLPISSSAWMMKNIMTSIVRLCFLYECMEGNKKCHYHETDHWKIILWFKKSVDIFQLATQKW